MDFIKGTFKAFKNFVMDTKQCIKDSFQEFCDVLKNRPYEIGIALLYLLAILLVHLLILFITVYPLYISAPELAKALKSRLHTDRPSISF